MQELEIIQYIAMAGFVFMVTWAALPWLWDIYEATCKKYRDSLTYPKQHVKKSPKSLHVPEKSFRLHDRVIKQRGDYTFKGAVIGVLDKVEDPSAETLIPSGQVRYAVQNEAGLVHIFHANQLDLQE